MTDPTPTRYRAFLSYSHRDQVWSRWLHGRLERYRVPRRLAAERGGELPRRLYPIFRDREELPTSADLGEMIRDALGRSDFLVVLCSPNAAASRWVNEEVLEFKRSGRAGRIVCLIIDGEPNASDKPEMSARECFPPAVRYEVGPDGELTETRCEPIAADARPGGDGRNDAFLKIAAALMGVGFDRLKRRDAQRRQRRMMALTGVSAAVAVVTILLATAAVLARGEASRQRNLAEARAVESLGLLTGTLADQGWRAFEQQDIPGALLWHTEALRRIEGGGLGTEAERSWARAQRLRVGSVDAIVPDLVFAFAHEPIDKHVADARFSPDGSMIATVGWDNTVRLWDAATGEARFPAFRTVGEYAETVAFSPDGGVLASGAYGGGVQLWDTATGQEIGDVIGTRNAASLVAGFSPDGSRVFAWGFGGGAAIMDAGTGAPLVELPIGAGPQQGVSVCALSGDRGHAVLCLGDGTVTRWDTTTGAKVGRSHAFGGRVTGAAFSGDGARLAVGGQFGAVRVWDLRSDELLGGWPAGGEAVNSIDWSPDNRRLLVAYAHGEVRVLELGRIAEPGHRVSVFNAGEFGVRARFLPPGDRYAVTVGDAVWVLDAETAGVIAGPMAHGDAARGARASPDGTRVLTWSSDSTARLWDPWIDPVAERIPASVRVEGFDTPARAGRAIIARDGTPYSTTPGALWSWARADSGVWERARLIEEDPYFIARALLELPDGTVVTSFGPTAYLLNPATGEITRVEPENSDGVYEIAYDAGRDRLILECGAVALADPGTGEILGSFGRDVGPSESTTAAFFGSGDRAVVAHSVNDIEEVTSLFLASMPGGETLPDPVTLTGGHWVVGLARDETAVVVAAPSAIELRSVDNLARVIESFPHAPSVYRTARRGDLVLVMGFGDARVWDVETGNPAGPLIRHDGAMVATLSHDGALLATGDDLGTVRVWNVGDGRLVMPAIRAGNRVTDLSFARDGGSLAVTATDVLVVPIRGTTEPASALARRAALLATRVIDDRGSVERLGRRAWLERYRESGAAGGP